MAKKFKPEKIQLTTDQLNEKKEFLKKRGKIFRVFYGYAKLTKKIVRKKELAIYYENCSAFSNDKYIRQKIHIVYQRKQTLLEMTDFDIGNRSFTKYGYFIDEKPWNGDIERILENNFIAEVNHVSKKERNKIREMLRKEYFSFYKVSPRPIGQQSLIFE
ncbi:MAG: hypothetical protein DI589_18795 [Shinella sp.]|nr:MAG: hypothetical protein DI589_18795 [Shinella sp.]